tara:strand:- start:94 stop:282 length:189 start_codon:yes stop_codon:yes gene_type:complete
MIGINDFIDTYVSMILGPEVDGRGYVGFKLSNNMKIFFKDTRIYPNQALRLAKHYKKNGIRQ